MLGGVFAGGFEAADAPGVLEIPGVAVAGVVPAAGAGVGTTAELLEAPGSD